MRLNLYVLILSSVLSGPLPVPTCQAQGTDITVKVPYKGKSYTGKPLAWTGEDLKLLRRDGRTCILPVDSMDEIETVSHQFTPYNANEMREKIQREFGSKYQVSLTRNFIVVHPPGDYQIWAMPFETLYARFDAYFSGRGYSLEAPEFPMVAVVLRTRKEFDKFLVAYSDYDSRVLGYYSRNSNRVITYDQTGGKAHSQNWLFNADTIIHEAAHQTAFNTGVHNRYGPVPRWVTEGLALLFEAPGVNDSMSYPRERDRINRDRLISLKRYYKMEDTQSNVAELVLSDRMFRSDPLRAYAFSWGLTFYLSEKMPGQYHQFLRADGAREDFMYYTGKQRAAAFAAAFGPKISDLEARMKDYFTNLEIPRK